MKYLIRLLFCAVVFFEGGALNAQDIIISSDSVPDCQFRERRSDVKPSVCSSSRDADGRTVYDIEVFQGAQKHYQTSAAFRSAAAVRKGDVLLAELDMRTVSARQETGEGVVVAYFQLGRDPWDKSMMTTISCGSEWTSFSIPFVSKHDYGAGDSVLELGLASLPQHIQLKNIRVSNFGRDRNVEDLPKTRFTYSGREDGARWRQEALDRIKELRTAPVNVTVRDSRGKVLRGAEVSVQMKESDFVWGSAVGTDAFVSGGKVDTLYGAMLKKYFNTAIITVGLKISGWYWGDERKGKTLTTFRWMEDNGMRMRGHNLVWPGWKFNPAATRMIAEQFPETFDALIKAQFHERMAFTKGKLIAWDVVNEPLHETAFFDYLPEDVMVDWFKLARQLDPDAQLFINEYAMLNCVQSPEMIASFIRLIEDLRKKGAPVDAVGIQGHFGTLPRAPRDVISDLDMFLPLGLPVQITEWDFDTEDEDLQADYTRDFLIAVYSHPAVTGINAWGFWEGDQWKPKGAMFRKDWTPKPNAKVWEDLVLGDWRTSVSAKTGKTGTVSSRAHFGEYDIRAEYKGRSYSATRHIGPEGLSIDITL